MNLNFDLTPPFSRAVKPFTTEVVRHANGELLYLHEVYRFSGRRFRDIRDGADFTHIGMCYRGGECLRDLTSRDYSSLRINVPPQGSFAGQPLSEWPNELMQQFVPVSVGLLVDALGASVHTKLINAACSAGNTVYGQCLSVASVAATAEPQLADALRYRSLYIVTTLPDHPFEAEYWPRLDFFKVETALEQSNDCTLAPYVSHNGAHHLLRSPHGAWYGRAAFCDPVLLASYLFLRACLYFEADSSIVNALRTEHGGFPAYWPSQFGIIPFELDALDGLGSERKYRTSSGITMQVSYHQDDLVILDPMTPHFETAILPVNFNNVISSRWQAPPGLQVDIVAASFDALKGRPTVLADKTNRLTARQLMLRHVFQDTADNALSGDLPPFMSEFQEAVCEDEGSI